jgi:hypothetical protein
VQLDGDARVAGKGDVVGEQHVADLGGDRVADVFLKTSVWGARSLRAL